MKTSNLIAKISKPQNIVCGQILHQVVTVENKDIKKDDVLKEVIIAKALQHAEVRQMKVKLIRFNDSETGLLVDGVIVDKEGNPFFKGTEKAKDNLVEGLEIPFNQNDVAREPGIFFGSAEDAQMFAKDINVLATRAAKRIKEVAESIISFNEELIEKGC